MALHSIKKGLDLPITGAPSGTLEDAREVAHVAIVASDFVGMKPRMLVQVGDTVKRGQALFEDRKQPGVVHTAPGAGTVKAIHRGAKRALQTVVIALSDSERKGNPGSDELQAFAAYKGDDVGAYSADELKALLTESGLWTSFRRRPYSRVPSPEEKPKAIFVTAMDTRPLSGDVKTLLDGRGEWFDKGLAALAVLHDGDLHVCQAPGESLTSATPGRFAVQEFKGPHPAGLPGTHIHFVDPVWREKVVWHIGWADVVAIGQLLINGVLPVDRNIALGGPTVKKPRLLRTRWGASLDELTRDELEAGENRVISGSVLSGTTAMGDELGYLGRYDDQVSALAEGRQREFLGWLDPGWNKFSTLPAFLSKLIPNNKKFALHTGTNGSERAMVPLGMYERVMPLDLMPTHLLRSIIVNDLERAEELGCMELAEEDLALCTVVCPGKYDYGPLLRKTLSTLEAEG